MNTNKINIRKLEADLWESADLLRAGSKLTSSQYCMPVLALLFLRYAYSRYKMVEKELMADRPMRNGRAMPIEASEVEAQSEQLTGILPKTYTMFSDDLLRELLRISNNKTLDEIGDKNYSLTPRAYVGVAEAEDDGVEFAPRMKEIHEKLAQLHTEANRLMDEIQKTWEGLI